MANSLRKSDSSAELEVGKYLDKYFYPQNTTNFKRFGDIETQMLGIDVQFDYKELKNILVDEKAMTHYINRDIPTFAFEINFISSAKTLIDGWLFDKAKKTEYYLACWLKATKDSDILCDDITEADCLLLHRAKIINMLADDNLDLRAINQMAIEIRSNGQAGPYQRDYSKPYYFYYTTHLVEHPINIIIKKNKLIELSTARFTIKPNKP